MSMHFDLPSPIGTIRITANDRAITRIELRGHEDAPVQARKASPSHPLLREATSQLRAYFEGQRKTFELPLAPAGTEFQRLVWSALTTIPFGETRSYLEIATQIGHRGASRAVGVANGRNPLPIVVPCHRVIGADGSLTGYEGGLAAKQWLLAHESPSRAAQRELFDSKLATP